MTAQINELLKSMRLRTAISQNNDKAGFIIEVNLYNVDIFYIF